MPFFPQLLQKIAKNLGARIILEPHWCYVGKIIFADGRVEFFDNTSLWLNSQGAAQIARDKDYAQFFLNQSSIKTPKGQAFFSNQWAKTIGSDKTIKKAIEYARAIGFPVFIKPNSAAQGKGVYLANTEDDFKNAAQSICRKHNVFLVQKPVTGRDYRCLVLDGEVVLVYERRSLILRGDGESTVKKLLILEQKKIEAQGRPVKLKLNNPECKTRFASLENGIKTILTKDEEFLPSPACNLSLGGEACDVTEIMHNSFKQIAISAVCALNLRWAGVDIMIDGDISKRERGNYAVLEINASPGLENFAKSVEDGSVKVEDIVVKLLNAK